MCLKTKDAQDEEMSLFEPNFHHLNGYVVSIAKNRRNMTKKHISKSEINNTKNPIID
jgi:hypothetical protein